MEPIKSIAVPATRRRTTGKRSALPEQSPVARLAPAIVDRRPPPPPRTTPRHVYELGQSLKMIGGGNRWTRAEGLCTVTALLPHEGGPLLYRVRSTVENYERVVAETDLAPEAILAPEA
jgi:hypothetical protein